MALRTFFRCLGGTAAVTDALALGAHDRGHELGKNVPRALLREVTCTSGEVELTTEFAPRPEYGLVTPLLAVDQAAAEVNKSMLADVIVATFEGACAPTETRPANVLIPFILDSVLRGKGSLGSAPA